MRRRLLVIVVVLVAGLIVALGVPLVRASADRAFQTSFIGRTEDTAWFADTAATALESGRTGRLRAAARRYGELYDSRVTVVDADSRVVVASRPLGLDTPRVRAALLLALADRPPERPGVVWPWDDRPFVLARSVKRDGRVLGAVVIVSPTDRTRAAVAEHLVFVVLSCLAALLVVVLAVAAPVVRWVLRPVGDLDRAAHEVALGRLSTRVSERAGAPELRRLANSFNVMADSVHLSREQQRAFVAQASHQLRNPLTALRLRVENLEEFVHDPLGLDELHDAVEEAGRFGDILDSLLRLARAEASEAERAPVDVSAVVGRRVSAWRAAYARAGVPLTADVPRGVRALCLPDCLDHALDTLLDNALKFGGGTPVDISVAVLPEGPVPPERPAGSAGRDDAAGTGHEGTGHELIGRQKRVRDQGGREPGGRDKAGRTGRRDRKSVV